MEPSKSADWLRPPSAQLQKGLLPG